MLTTCLEQLRDAAEAAMAAYCTLLDTLTLFVGQVNMEVK